MISCDYCRLMAGYNSWQNSCLVAAASTLDHADRWRDRGAFFGSIAATFNHLYWADALMLKRMTGDARPECKITHVLTAPADWDDFCIRRKMRDREIEDWAAGLQNGDLQGAVSWRPGDGTVQLQSPKAVAVIQLFNHQTHHRGQIHAMLTAAGATPEPTDLSALPGQVALRSWP